MEIEAANRPRECMGGNRPAWETGQKGAPQKTCADSLSLYELIRSSPCNVCSQPPVKRGEHHESLISHRKGTIYKIHHKSTPQRLD